VWRDVCPFLLRNSIMKFKTYRARCKNINQNALFPQELNSNTEFWYEWEYVEIFAIQRAMLVQALKEISDLRRSKKMRLEAWNWLMSDDDEPFSAPLCASNNNYDIHELRRLVKRIVHEI
jgi:hypothetical protein